MVNKKIAETIKKQSLRAVEELNRLLFQVQEQCSDEEFYVLRRGVGSSIIEIQTELLDPVYGEYPELDDLK
jgi:hypothetical protein